MITALTNSLNLPTESVKAEPRAKRRKVMDEEKKPREEEAPERNEEEEEQEEEFLIQSPSHLKQVFEGDSDEESFLGFPDC